MTQFAFSWTFGGALSGVEHSTCRRGEIGAFVYEPGARILPGPGDPMAGHPDLDQRPGQQPPHCRGRLQSRRPRAAPGGHRSTRARRCDLLYQGRAVAAGQGLISARLSRQVAGMATVLIDYDSGNLHFGAQGVSTHGAETGGGRGHRDLFARHGRAGHRIVLPGDLAAFPIAGPNCSGFPACQAMIERYDSRRACPARESASGELMAARGYEFAEPGPWALDRRRRSAKISPRLFLAHARCRMMGWNDLVIEPLSTPLPLGDGGSTSGVIHALFLSIPTRWNNRARAPCWPICYYGGGCSRHRRHRNRIGTQIHPEKSQAAGLRLIANFLTWRP